MDEVGAPSETYRIARSVKNSWRIRDELEFRFGRVCHREWHCWCVRYVVLTDWMDGWLVDLRYAADRVMRMACIDVTLVSSNDRHRVFSGQ